jgi:hypothetical protein
MVTSEGNMLYIMVLDYTALCQERDFARTPVLCDIARHRWFATQLPASPRGGKAG